jgi:RHS repeat-associated protein
MDRLTSDTTSAGTEQFTIDGNGNRLTHVLPGGTETLSYDSVNNQLLSVSGTIGGVAHTQSYEYDDIGNVTQRLGYPSSEIYTYDGFTELASMTSGSVVAQYSYNGNGLRVQKAVSGDGTYRYSYGQGGELLSETGKNSAAIQRNYVWMNGVVVGILDADNVYFVHNDYLGRPETVTNGSKASVWHAQNTAFGRTVQSATFGSLNIGLPGQYWDSESGLWYNWNRYYDAVTGRYLESDPADIASGFSTYSYASGKPVSTIDPSGLAGMAIYFNGYSVDTGAGFSLPLGHAGVVAIDDKTGAGQYFDFGRYGGEYGNVRGPFEAGTLVFDKNGSPTADSLHAMGQTLAQQFGKGNTATMIYDKDADASKIVQFALSRQGHEKQFPYTINPFSKNPLNFCDTFALDALSAGQKK